MTSKEALQELLLSLYIPTKDVRDINKDVKLIDIISKDLEILELLKSQIVSKDGTTTTFDTRDYRIKEWLENDNAIKQMEDSKFDKEFQQRTNECQQDFDGIKILNVIKRIISDNDTYINIDFAGNKLYIDGCTEYKNEEEKKLIKEWVEDDK